MATRIGPACHQVQPHQDIIVTISHGLPLGGAAASSVLIHTPQG